MVENRKRVSGEVVSNPASVSLGISSGPDRNSSDQSVWRRWADILFLPLLSVVLTALLLYFSVLKTWDQVVYDGNIKTWQRTPSEDIVIIEIDERSLSELGRWPWPRDVYPQVVDKLTRANARAVGIDILFSEASREYPEHDVALTQAIERNGRVVMPVLFEQRRLNSQFVETMPLAPMIEASASLGHVDHPLEDDSVARGVALKAGLGDPRWSSFSLAMLEVGANTNLFDLTGNVVRTDEETASPFVWVRNHVVLTPFAGPPGTFARASFTDVLNGVYPDDYFKNKFVLIGVTAAGLGDILPTPVSGKSHPMPGVEIIANEVDMLINRMAITTLPLTATTTITLLLVVVPPLLYRRFRPRWSLFTCVGSIVLALAISFVLLRYAYLWYPPVVALVVLVSIYVLWAWRRLVQTVRYLNTELERLDAEPSIVQRNDDVSVMVHNARPMMEAVLPISGCVLRTPDGSLKYGWGQEPSKTVHNISAGKWTGRLTAWWTRIEHKGEPWQLGVRWVGGNEPDFAEKNVMSILAARLSDDAKPSGYNPVEFVQARIDQVKAATERLQSLRRFVSDAMAQMADGVVVTDALGQILVANQRVADYAGFNSEEELVGQPFERLTQRLKLPESVSWPDSLQKVLIEHTAQQFSMRDEQKRNLLLQMVPFSFEGDVAPGLLLNIADVTELTEAERQRRELMGYMSHDLRAPLVSILAMTELAKLKPEKTASPEQMQRIERHAGTTLDLVDNVLALTKAERVEMTKFSPIDMVPVVHNALDAVMAPAQTRNITLEHHLPERLALKGDAELLERMWINLLSNAIKYSPDNATVTARLELEDAWIRCSVEDTGFGISESDKNLLFQRFERIKREEHKGQKGTGLGLVFVKTVAERHGGMVEVSSEVGKGSTFTVVLPSR